MYQVERSPFFVVGQLGKPHGLLGWLTCILHAAPETFLAVKTLYRSHPDKPPEILSLQTTAYRAGKALVKLNGVGSRSLAEAWRGTELVIPLTALPPPPQGEYYWDQLMGCRVVNLQSAFLGQVKSLLETGAHDVLVVVGAQRERLIPFVESAVIKTVDLASSQIVVDWDSNF